MLTARTEQARPRRQGWEVRRWALLLPILVLAATGCARQGTATPQAAAKVATSPATVTVGPTDGGRTVDLRVGDRLIVQLTGTTPPSRLRPTWTRRSPASKVLRRVPGNPTQSYRTRHPLRIVGELDDWTGHDPEVLERTLAGLARLRAAAPAHLARVRGRVIDHLGDLDLPPLAAALRRIEQALG